MYCASDEYIYKLHQIAHLCSKSSDPLLELTSAAQEFDSLSVTWWVRPGKVSRCVPGRGDLPPALWSCPCHPANWLRTRSVKQKCRRHTFDFWFTPIVGTKVVQFMTLIKIAWKLIESMFSKTENSWEIFKSGLICWFPINPRQDRTWSFQVKILRFTFLFFLVRQCLVCVCPF